ncbi:hypothetical protein AB0M54_06505 [Actinoplanes sp. NPDC051470]|uniref:hypothetical protein n=1 Tax=Actinoplanes sp. NPDC051470 TaxID=3157224 RepID=UPI00343E09A9
MDDDARRRLRYLWLPLGLLVAALAAYTLFVIKPFSDEYPDVPGCRRISDDLWSVTGHTWAVDNTSAPMAGGPYPSALCTFGYRASDGTVEGSVVLELTGDTDDERVRAEVDRTACQGETAVADPGGAFRMCVRRIGGNDEVSVVAADHPRWTTVTVTAVAEGDRMPFARDLAQTVANRALTLPAAP